MHMVCPCKRIQEVLLISTWVCCTACTANITQPQVGRSSLQVEQGSQAILKPHNTRVSILSAHCSRNLSSCLTRVHRVHPESCDLLLICKQ